MDAVAAKADTRECTTHLCNSISGIPSLELQLVGILCSVSAGFSLPFGRTPSAEQIIQLNFAHLKRKSTFIAFLRMLGSLKYFATWQACRLFEERVK